MDEPSRQPANSKVPPGDDPMLYGDIMSKQRIKQITALAILIGVMFSGIGGLFSYEQYEVLKEGVPPTIAWWAERFETIGNFFMIIAPVILIIVDWRNIFPNIREHKDK